MASSQERFWGLQDSPQFSWQGNPGWVLGCQGFLAALPCPRVTSSGQPPSQLALTWASLALPDMVLGAYDRLQPSPHTPPALSALKYVLPEASGGSFPSDGPLPNGPCSFRDPQLSSLAPTVRQIPCSQSSIVWVGEHSNHNT